MLSKFKIGDKLNTYRVATWSTRPGAKGDDLGREYFDFVVVDIRFGKISEEPYYVDEGDRLWAETNCTLKEEDNGT